MAPTTKVAGIIALNGSFTDPVPVHVPVIGWVRMFDLLIHGNRFLLLNSDPHSSSNTKK